MQQITDYPSPPQQPWGYNPPPPPSEKKSRGRRYLVITGVLFAMGLAAAAGAASGTEDTGTSGGTATAAPASTSMGYWVSRYGSPDSQILGSDFTAMQSAAGSYDLDEMASSCQKFQQHLSLADSHLPSPDAALTSALRSAYSYYDRAASACIRGEITESTRYLRLGLTEIERATDIIRSLN